jgi:hypothetical protein
MNGYDNDDHIKNMQNPEANKYCPNRNPVLNFSGKDWWINYHWSQQTGIYADSNFDSIWNPKIIEQTSDGVRLWIQPPDSSLGPKWQTSEIVCVDKVAYGRYLVTARADDGSFSNFDKNAVFGVFTYQYSEAPPPTPPPNPPTRFNKHREIDMMEVLRGANSNAQFTLQPWDLDPHPWYPFNLPDNTPVITIVTDWYIDPGYNRTITYAGFLGDYSLETLPPTPWEGKAYALWYPNKDGFRDLIPAVTATSCARLHINLWLMQGQAPSDGQAHSVTVTRFQFAPPKTG